MGAVPNVVPNGRFPVLVSTPTLSKALWIVGQVLVNPRTRPANVAPKPQISPPKHAIPPPAVAAFQTCPSLGALAAALLEAGPWALASRLALRPGVPVQPMLAQPAAGVGAALAKVGAGGGGALAEFKYDGLRAQMHLVSEGEVKG